MFVGCLLKPVWQTSVDGSTHYRIKVAKTSAYVCVQKTYVSLLSYLTKSEGTRDKNIYNARPAEPVRLVRPKPDHFSRSENVIW